MIKNIAGRSFSEWEKNANLYFSNCEENSEPITVTGLAIAVNMSREALMEFLDKKKNKPGVMMVRLKVENAYEKRMIARGNSGDIFAMKNFGWSDKKDGEENNDTEVKVEWEKGKEWGE